MFVTPEYNYGFTAPLKNAIDYLHEEWAYKPVGFVSYWGVAAGTRSVHILKQVVTVLRMTTPQESVNIPFFAEYLTDAALLLGRTDLASTGDLRHRDRRSVHPRERSAAGGVRVGQS